MVGPGEAEGEVLRLAEEAGTRIAETGAVLVTGGLGGAMEAACRGAKKASGVTLGILPGSDRREANPFVDIAVPTGMGEMRNALVVRASDGILALDGGFGTLSELALALKLGKPVVSLASWELSVGGRPAEVHTAPSPREAVETLMRLVAPTAGRLTGRTPGQIIRGI